MNFFRFIFALFILFFSQSSFAAYTCGVGSDVVLTTNMDDYPSTICANVGGNNCLVQETHSEKTSNGWTVYAKSTGEACSTPTNLNPPKVPDDGCTRLPNGSIECPDPETPPDDTVLQCTSDSCPNPDNKRCPSGYVRGSYNGQSLCVKSSNPDPDPSDPNPNPSTAEIIGAIDKANSDINGSLGDLTNALSEMFGDLTNVLKDIAAKLSEIAKGSGNSSGDGDGETHGPVDTSGMDAPVPFEQQKKQEFKENLFTSNAQCPPDNILTLNLNGKNLTHKFSYLEICNSLNMLSYFIMCGAYLIGCYILVKT